MTKPAYTPYPFGGWMNPVNVDLKNKNTAISYHVRYMLNRTSRMFDWKGLPKTIPAYIMEQMVQCAGAIFITDVRGEVYALNGNVGGEPDAYYRGTDFVAANPALNIGRSFKIGTEGILFQNDHLRTGLLPIFNRYGTMIAENELSMMIATITSRIQFLITAKENRDKQAADEFIKGIIRGDLSSVNEVGFLDENSIRVQPAAMAGSAHVLTELIEQEQYLKASEFNEIGLDANYNMKRESLSMTESQMNTDALLPLVDDMFECRREFCEEYNRKYGAEYGRISVDYASSWKDRQIEQNAKEGDANVEFN